MSQQLIWSFCLVAALAFGVAAGDSVQGQTLTPAANDKPLVEYKLFPSKKLGRDFRYGIQLPPSYATSKQRYPVVIFLHGRFENEKRWEERGAAVIADTLRRDGKIGEMIFVTPFGANGFYTDSFDGKELWEQAIVDDLLEHLDQTYRTMAGPKGRVIGGLSMGGYGALKIAFRYPEKFTAVIAHCPAILLMPPPKPTQPTGGRSYYQAYSPIFGDPINMELWQSNDPLVLGQRNAARIKQSGLKVYFDCGTEDRYFFFNGAKELAKVLTEAQIKHDFHLLPGPHGWDFVRTRLDQSLVFAWQSLGKK